MLMISLMLMFLMLKRIKEKIIKLFTRKIVS